MQTTRSSSLAATGSTHFARAGRFRTGPWNVDGLERLCDTPQYAGGDLKTFLDGFDADIVCIQETKVRKRDEKQRDLPLPARFCSADDYSVVASTAAYGNWAKPPEGLWGVTVCARKASVMPSKAETGLALGKRKQALHATERIGNYPDVDALDIPVAKLNTVEGEGRIVVLDCKVFVLISIYMPNLTKYEPGKKRDPAELARVLRTVLQARVELLRAAGREVLILGDFNVPPTSNDTHLGTVENCKKPGQRWFEEMTSPTGCALVNVHEHFRRGTEPQYTYFSGEKNKSRNLGTRIDLALATGGLLKWIQGAGIDHTKTGSDHLPIYVDLFEAIDDPERGHLESLAGTQRAGRLACARGSRAATRARARGTSPQPAARPAVLPTSRTVVHDQHDGTGEHVGERASRRPEADEQGIASPREAGCRTPDRLGG